MKRTFPPEAYSSVCEPPAEVADLQDPRWQAVLHRDRAADGTFVYAVRSTGIFCRPSCPSRRPLARHVSFYSTASQASAAGYRPCLRCAPLTVPPSVARTAAVAAQLQTDPNASLEQLGSVAHLSPGQLQRNFTALTGISPRQFGAATRRTQLERGLRAGESVTTASNDAGYGSVRALYEEGAEMGFTPASYGKGGAGAVIAFATVACPLGRLLAATTARGVCSVTVGASDEELEAALRRDFPAATIQRDDEALRPVLELLLDSLAGRAPHPQLPLDVRATAFTWLVWTQLRKIARGETVSYSHVAESIGRPGSVRAVARAIGCNPLFFIHPCHRVIGKDGSLTGFRWGLEAKRTLLELESSGTQMVPPLNAKPRE